MIGTLPSRKQRFPLLCCLLLFLLVFEAQYDARKLFWVIRKCQAMNSGPLCVTSWKEDVDRGKWDDTNFIKPQVLWILKSE